MMYVQCKLRKENAVDVAWIEDKKIEVGKIVEIKRPDGTFDPGWHIEATYGRVDKEQMLVARDVWKDHRKVTDI